uniref:Uncharacterized protein n=1 Tax=Anguilla anguilla TaxID=7936 RepID=A0A0E9VXI9_ANGAN
MICDVQKYSNEETRSGVERSEAELTRRLWRHVSLNVYATLRQCMTSL